MRIAWFHRHPYIPAIDAPDAVDLAAELARTHHVDRFVDAHAHDFPPLHFRTPYDAVVYELGDTPAHAFMWPYVCHYPGVLALQACTLEHARAAALFKARRTHHLRAERSLGGWTLLGAPIAASKLVVMRDAATADALRDRYPAAEIRVVPIGVTPLTLPAPAVESGFSQTNGGRFVVVGDRADVAERAAARAREAGAVVTVTADTSTLRQGDCVIALEWPPTGAAPVAAVRAMASGLAAIVFETEAVAPWPTLDPQTWRPRGYVPAGVPVAISIDPRDEEHSLMLAMKRLTTDASLAMKLGTAAQAWAAQHAGVHAAAAAWTDVLREAAGMPAPARTELPRHLVPDGTSRARALLAEMGARVDFLE